VGLETMSKEFHIRIPPVARRLKNCDRRTDTGLEEVVKNLKGRACKVPEGQRYRGPGSYTYVVVKKVSRETEARDQHRWLPREVLPFVRAYEENMRGRGFRKAQSTYM
jgi:hypothetical protein